jgi:hypothetical protein
MPYRNQATVQSWIDDYISARPDQAADVTVLEKNFTSGPESGLVVVSLSNATTVTYIQPVVDDEGPRWVVTFEPRADAFDLDAAGVGRLAADLATIAGLCGFLQMRTDAALAAASGPAA